MMIHTIHMNRRYEPIRAFPRASRHSSRDELAPAACSCHPESSPACALCQGARICACADRGNHVEVSFPSTTISDTVEVELDHHCETRTIPTDFDLVKKSRFMPSHGCIDVKATLKTALQSLKDSKTEACVLSSNLVKAFNSVNREMMW
jgi:hypothetical protein